jgi:hypothetical protein
MSSHDRIQELLCEAASLLGVGSLTAYDSAPAWRLARDGTDFRVEHDPEHDSIVISAAVGAVADAARTRTYQMLLQYNNLWPQTGGVRMALDGPQRTVVMILELGTACLSAARLARVISNMAGVHAGWRDLLQLSAATAQGTEAAVPAAAMAPAAFA